jgi:hypothetical protein
MIKHYFEEIEIRKITFIATHLRMAIFNTYFQYED